MHAGATLVQQAWPAAPQGRHVPLVQSWRAMHCDAPEHRLPAATRKAMIVSFGLLAARRINRLADPQGHGDIDE